MDALKVARAVAAGRLAFGVGMMAAPAKLMGAWIGQSEAERPAMDMVVRAFGAREILLGFIGVHVAGTRGVGKRTIGTMALLDATDLTMTIVHRKSLPKAALPIVAGVAGGAVVAQAWAARELP